MSTPTSKKRSDIISGSPSPMMNLFRKGLLHGAGFNTDKLSDPAADRDRQFAHRAHDRALASRPARAQGARRHPRRRRRMRGVQRAGALRRCRDGARRHALRARAARPDRRQHRDAHPFATLRRHGGDRRLRQDQPGDDDGGGPARPAGDLPVRRPGPDGHPQRGRPAQLDRPRRLRRRPVAADEDRDVLDLRRVRDHGNREHVPVPRRGVRALPAGQQQHPGLARGQARCGASHRRADRRRWSRKA